MSSVEWVDPLSIRFKITPDDDLRGRREGDWDVTRRQPLEQAPKHRAIHQRYAQGLPWEETVLFRETYRRRIANEPIRGCPSLKELLAQYYTRVDGMFADLKRNGFRSDQPLPKLLIGRGGEVFIGNQGNHRLAMAHVIGLKRFAGEIVCRHSLSAA